MCGIAGAVSLRHEPIPALTAVLAAMTAIQRHRGPDGEGAWESADGTVGFAHQRLAIIDLNTGQQPMTDHLGNWVTYNGEIYNYRELREELGADLFRTESDTEVILHAYRKWGQDCVRHFRGMFAFALWDAERQTLFSARDRFGIKPLYYTLSNGVLYFASEVKTLLPFVPEIATDLEGFKDYLTFQFCLAGKTLFRHVREVLPGHTLTVRDGASLQSRYWEVYYEPDFDHTPRYFEERIRDLLTESVELHLRSDVPVGAYVSGGIDSSIVAALAARQQPGEFFGFTGKFGSGTSYDESGYARILALTEGFALKEIDLGEDDFVDNIERVIYHLDYPIAGPGSFPQFMVSGLAARDRKVLLGGQGGDEVFGGYTRYLIAYFEQCIKAAIDGTMHNGNFVVTYESIIPNLGALRSYKPLLQEFWRDGLFEDIDRRYFRLVNRAPTLGDEINWDLLTDYSPYETFRTIFRGDNVRRESYFDSMTHFDFKTLLPALLQVEDRVSMAHGLESRVPFLDHPLIELAACMPADVKFKNGTMKHALKSAMGGVLPSPILERTDKMGFPVPLQEWLTQRGQTRDFVADVLSSQSARNRDLVNNRAVLAGLDQESKFGRKIWGLLCIELWQRAFHDRAAEIRRAVRSQVPQEVLA